MGQACGKNHVYERAELIYYEKQVIKSVKAEIRSKFSKTQSIKQVCGRQEYLTLLMQPELYQELQIKLANEQDISKESIQIVLNIFIYCNFKGEKIKNCFNLLNTNSDYKEDLKLIGIYRESSLKCHKNDSCLLCLSENIECYSLKCQHKFCKDCWNQMIEIQLSNFIPIVKCLEYRCQERLPHLYLEQNQSYKEILVKRMLDNDRNFTWCPGFQCQNIYKLEQFSQKQKCHCGLKFCPNCKTENHYPITCYIYNEITQFKEANQSWISLDISACPICKRCIQKIQGCMQISCVCGNDFCVKCSQPWNPDHGQDFYNCPFAAHNKNPSQIMNQMCLNESAISRIIFELEYYQRLLNQQDQNDFTHILRRGLNNLIKFKKFEKMQQIMLVYVLYYTYYQNEKFGDNGFDHSYKQYSLELQNYYRILLNQLSSVLEDVQKTENKEKIEFNIFQNLVFQMDLNLYTQKQGVKKQIIENQQERQQNVH